MAAKETAPPEVAPVKSRDIGMRQMYQLARVEPAARLRLLADGLPILLASTEDLIAAAETLRGKHPRAAAIIERQAHEEAAKILILLDYVRCPLSMSDRAQGQIAAFYRHESRAIYAKACNWVAYDVEMLRGYVDSTRASHSVEGNVGEWIIPNWDFYRREAELYADLTRVDTGAFAWNEPLDWRPVDGLLPRFEASVLGLVRALGRLGFYNAEALRIFADIWRPHAFMSAAEGSELAERLLEETLTAFMEKGLVSDDATDADLRTAYRSWPLPMYAIDVLPRDVPLEDLRAEQEAALYRGIGY
jgi:hypothetical protein